MKYIIIPIFKFLWVVILFVVVTIYYMFYIPSIFFWNLSFYKDDMKYVFHTDYSFNYSPYFEFNEKFQDYYIFKTIYHFILNKK